MHKNYRVLSVILIQHIYQARAIKSCILFKHWVHLKVSRHFSHCLYLFNYQRTFLDGNIFKPRVKFYRENYTPQKRLIGIN